MNFEEFTDSEPAWRSPICVIQSIMVYQEFLLEILYNLDNLPENIYCLVPALYTLVARSDVVLARSRAGCKGTFAFLSQAALIQKSDRSEYFGGTSHCERRTTTVFLEALPVTKFRWRKAGNF